MQATTSQLDAESDLSHDASKESFARTLPSSTRSAPNLLVSVLSSREQLILELLVAGWIASLAVFYLWWFQFKHVHGVFGFVVNSLLVTWTLALPGYFLFFVLQMKRVNPGLEIPRHWRVAMIVTRAPSEPFEVVKRTLTAMLAQCFPHDTWLADEAPTDEIRQWCLEHGVNISTRQGVAAYHCESWPRRTRCKEGNLAYFYDHYGYDHYDFVAQFDADHIPESGYLEAVLRPFLSDTVGYVSAPSICDDNAHISWAARGRLYSESIMHGPLQAGYCNGYAPLCIGSHYTVRMAALREIGGIGPELAEDHSTTLTMNGHGWRGVHALDAIAHGEGPAMFSDCMTQEFQWSRSLMVLLLTLLPKYWSRLPLSYRLQFLFSELWYPLFSASVAIGLVLPIVAIVLKEPWVEVSYLDYLLHGTPVILMTLACVSWLKLSGTLRPHYSPVVCWEAALFQLVRWPWSLYGSLVGMWVAITKRHVDFRVTPKGQTLAGSMPWKIIAPYLLVVILSFLPTIGVRDAGKAVGYYFFIILTLIIYLAATFTIVLAHHYDAKRKN